jgi:hypothetical protein
MAMASIQPLTEMIAKNISRVKGWSARKPDNLAAIYEPYLENLATWSLKTVWTSTACYRNSCTF